MDLTDRRHRAALIAAITGGLVLLALVGIGLYGLFTGTNPARERTGTDVPEQTTTRPSPDTALGNGPQQIPTSSDPEETARAIIEGLFVWDTTSGYSPSDYAQAVADVTSTLEADAAASDVRGYLPTPAAWVQLRTHQTRQWISITELEVPAAWETAVQQAAPGQILPGMTAYTVTGIRHRAGTWSTEPIEAERPVTFTVFLVCDEPASGSNAEDNDGAGQCQLLRLSQLDTPLQ